ncbi:MAG: PilZ domain-containing protein [Thermoleophilia bacterium]|nr:PilZ domain-containing protein [Thermoleophilia bacterium]
MSGLAHIRTPGGRYLVTRVRESSGDTLVLETPLDARGWWLPAAGTAVEVGSLHDGAMAWAGAVVTGAGAKDGSLVVLRLLGSPVLVEQRRYPRVALEHEVEIRRGPSAGPVRGLCTDIGGGGLRVTVPLALDLGDLVRVAFRPAGAAPVEATARVVRRIEPSSFGLVFELFVVGGRDRVERLAFERAAARR